jgi:hypothetical protein
MNGTDPNLPLTAGGIDWTVTPATWPSVDVEAAIESDEAPDALTILALSEARLRKRVSDLEVERDSYRTLAQQGIQALADLTTRHTRQAARYHALLDECRKLRRDCSRAA